MRVTSVLTALSPPPPPILLTHFAPHPPDADQPAALAADAAARLDAHIPFPVDASGAEGQRLWRLPGPSRGRGSGSSPTPLPLDQPPCPARQSHPLAHLAPIFPGLVDGILRSIMHRQPSSEKAPGNCHLQQTHCRARNAVLKGKHQASFVPRELATTPGAQEDQAHAHWRGTRNAPATIASITDIAPTSLDRWTAAPHQQSRPLTAIAGAPAAAGRTRRARYARLCSPGRPRRLVVALDAGTSQACVYPHCHYSTDRQETPARYERVGPQHRLQPPRSVLRYVAHEPGVGLGCGRGGVAEAVLSQAGGCLPCPGRSVAQRPGPASALTTTGAPWLHQTHVCGILRAERVCCDAKGNQGLAEYCVAGAHTVVH